MNPSPLEKLLSEQEPKSRVFLSQFVLHCDQQGDCEGCKHDMDAVIESINLIATRAYEAGVKAENARVLAAVDDYIAINRMKIERMDRYVLDNVPELLRAITNK